MCCDDTPRLFVAAPCPMGMGDPLPPTRPPRDSLPHDIPATLHTRSSVKYETGVPASIVSIAGYVPFRMPLTPSSSTFSSLFLLSSCVSHRAANWRLPFKRGDHCSKYQCSLRALTWLIGRQGRRSPRKNSHLYVRSPLLSFGSCH